MDKIEAATEHVVQETLADVVAAVKADERYAPLVAQLAEKALAGLAELAAG